MINQRLLYMQQTSSCIRTILAAVSALTRSMLFLITASCCSLVLRTVLGSSLHVGQTKNPIVSFSDKFTQVTCNHIWYHEHCIKLLLSVPLQIHCTSELDSLFVFFQGFCLCFLFLSINLFIISATYINFCHLWGSFSVIYFLFNRQTII